MLFRTIGSHQEQVNGKQRPIPLFLTSWILGNSGTLPRRSWENRNRTSPNAELQPPDNPDVTFGYCANSPRDCSDPAALRHIKHIPAWISAAYLQCQYLSSCRGAGLPCRTPDWSGTWHQSCGDKPREHSQHTAQPGIAAGGSQKQGFSSPLLFIWRLFVSEMPHICTTATHHTLTSKLSDVIKTTWAYSKARLTF